MVEFTFGDDAEMIAEGIFIVADKHPSIGEMIKCRDAGIFIRHHGLEQEPGYHILRIAKDVEKMINHMDKFDIMFGDVPLVDLVPKGITDEDEWAFCLLALAVAILARSIRTRRRFRDRSTRRRSLRSCHSRRERAVSHEYARIVEAGAGWHQDGVHWQSQKDARSARTDDPSTRQQNGGGH